MIRFWNNFTKITAWPVQKLCFRTKILYEDREAQGRGFKGAAIIICNHTSIWDYAVLLFVFLGRTVRYQMAEVLFEKKLLGWFLRRLGGIRVDRKSHDFGFLALSEELLSRGGAVGVFPESRLPEKWEERPLPFQPSVAYLALSSGVPVIPVYTNGSYFSRKRARVFIGRPMYASEFTDEAKSDKENIAAVTDAFRNRVIKLGKELDEYERNTKANRKEAGDAGKAEEAEEPRQSARH